MVCATATLGQLPQGPAAVDWPMFRGRGGDGRVPWLPDKMPAKKLLWQVASNPDVNGGMAAAEGVVVVSDWDGKQDVWMGLDLATGKEIWKRTFDNAREIDEDSATGGRLLWKQSHPDDSEMEFGGGPRATPVIADGKVYGLGAFGDLHCFDLKTGKTIWQKDLTAEFKTGDVPTWGYCSSPVLAGGKLIVNPGGRTAVAAINPADGAVLWKGEGTGINYSSPIVAKLGGVDQVVYFDAASLGGWRLADGKRLWKIKAETGGGYIVPTPLAIDGRLFVAYEGGDPRLYEFAEGGAIKPEPAVSADGDLLAPEVVTPTLAGGMILGFHDALVALDPQTLEQHWVNDQEPAFLGPIHIVSSGNTILTFDDRGTMALATVNKEDAKVIGKLKLCGGTLAHPTLANGKIIVRDEKAVYCYDLTAGE